MKFKKTKLNDLYMIEPEPFQDERGKFFRIFCNKEFELIKHSKEIVQVNQSMTKIKGSIRGMHFQYPPKAEIKLVRCLYGSVFDVAIDLRKKSPTLFQWYSEILTPENMKMMYIPEGFAHGFQTLEDNTGLIYFHTDYYSAEHEGGVRFNDPKINIKWPLVISYISKSDKEIKLINEVIEGIEL